MVGPSPARLLLQKVPRSSGGHSIKDQAREVPAMRFGRHRTGPGCPGYLVLILALAVLDPGLAERDGRTEIFLPNKFPYHCPGDNLLLGGEDDNGRARVQEGCAVLPRLY